MVAVADPVASGHTGLFHEFAENFGANEDGDSAGKRALSEALALPPGD